MQRLSLPLLISLPSPQTRVFFTAPRAVLSPTGIIRWEMTGQTSRSFSPKTGKGTAFRNEPPDLTGLSRSHIYQSKATDFDLKASPRALTPTLICRVTIWLQRCSANQPNRPLGGSTSTTINLALPKRCFQPLEGHLETSKEAFSRPPKVQ